MAVSVCKLYADRATQLSCKLEIHPKLQTLQLLHLFEDVSKPQIIQHVRETILMSAPCYRFSLKLGGQPELYCMLERKPGPAAGSMLIGAAGGAMGGAAGIAANGRASGAEGKGPDFGIGAAGPGARPRMRAACVWLMTAAASAALPCVTALVAPAASAAAIAGLRVGDCAKAWQIVSRIARAWFLCLKHALLCQPHAPAIPNESTELVAMGVCRFGHLYRDHSSCLLTMLATGRTSSLRVAGMRASRGAPRSARRCRTRSRGTSAAG